MYISIDLGNLHSMLQVLSILSCEELYRSQQKIVFKITHDCNRYIKNDVYILLVSLTAELRSQNKEVSFEIDTGCNCSKIIYASRINFFRLIGYDYTERYRRNQSFNLVEISHLSNDSYALDSRIMDIISTSCRFPEYQDGDFFTIINELTCNVKLHSNCASGGYVYCQKYPERNKIELVIVDSGIGIKRSLGTRFADLSNREAILKSIERGVTNGNGRGYGLYYLSSWIVENKGNFQIISGDNYIVGNSNGIVSGENKYWNGVVIKFEINIIDNQSIYKSINVT